MEKLKPGLDCGVFDFMDACGLTETDDVDEEEDARGVDVTFDDVLSVLEVEELLLVDVACDRRRLGWYLYSVQIEIILF